MPAGADTADAILRCARSLIVAGGYNGFSYADIADAVGIRKASVHHHFSTKAVLVRILVQRYRAEFDAGVAEIERHFPDPADRLRAYLGYWQDCIGEPSSSFCVCALLSTEIPLLPAEVVVELKGHFQTLSAWLASVLQAGADHGTFTLSADAHTEAEAFMATVHGAMLSVRAYGDPGIFTTITDALTARVATQH
ncbi:TetR/AcrR family transcriptional regulator [Mycolicibacterium fluoranthenivorans]|jgi:TetR/AcrR family transcriptional repressor of nem operon|uniref:TetR/AcrR family transcriptional regulator n=1 Tax=Mycolicibacterium fluoranthenivorans TaxID=258505 RepID=A0A1G4WS93_9MYCO|nr:TetR/AcrR family transcriptional regulator [Mycolicibacterium fluoranthenivorans]QNJ90861.1 TetR/AcrR family transcriptional regulator [Mycolicibacterium fluoranthenivorans]SCX27687.1 transcriptional regulator, TetR family [Mycolicibacterium fluoranthenivorans]